MDRREALVYLGGLAAFSLLSAQPAPSDLPAASQSVHLTPAHPVERDYVSFARLCAYEAGIDATLFVRQINPESGFNPHAVSSAGAIGIAQFMPQTAASLGVDPSDPVSSLRGAARLMASYLRYYGNYACALAAYNAGGAAVNAARQHGVSWLSWLPVETQHYVAVILG